MRWRWFTEGEAAMLLDRTEALEAKVRALEGRMDKVDPPPAAGHLPGAGEEEEPTKAKGSPKK